MKRSLCLLIYYFFCSLAMPVQAGERLSVPQALEAAFEHNPDVVEARKNAEIAKAQLKITGKWENPEIDIEAANLAKDLEGDPVFSTRQIESEIRFTQPVKSWGKKGLKKKIAQDVFQQRQAVFKNVWAGVVKSIKEQYSLTLLDAKDVELAEENLALSQRFLDQIKVKFDSGKVLNHELYRAKLEVINARNELMRARKNHIIARGKLNLLLGQSITQEYELIDTFTIKRLDGSFDVLLAQAQKARPDIFIQEKEVDLKDKELKLARKERLPDYDVSLFIEREDSIYKGGVGITFKLPLWNLGANEVAQAKLEKEKSEILLGRLKDEAALEVYAAFHEADLARISHEISLEAMKEADEILRFTTLGYEEGEVSFLSYLENIKAYRETRQNYFKSVSEYTIKIAVLEQAIGGQGNIHE